MTSADPDLRTLAAEALGLSVIGAKLPPAEVTIRHADAVLAAVLPEHRRVVLTEAADDLHRVATHLRATNPDSSVAKGVRYAEARIRAQLTAAPPAGLSAPVPAENAPAVPEEADGQRVAEGDALTYAEMEAERDRLAGEVFTLTNSESLDVVAAELERDNARADRDRLAAQVEELRRYAEEHRQRILRVREAPGEPGEVSQIFISVDEADVDALRAEVRRLDHRLRWAYRHSDNDATASMLVAYELADQRDRLAAQVAQFRRVVERVRALHTEFDGRCAECVNYCDCIDRVAELGDDVEVAAAMRMCEHGNKPWPCPTIAAVDALPDVGPHQHECACNRNWGGPCGPCVCEEPPRQGVWRLVCGAGNIPPNQTYATRGAAEDVMRLHDGACLGAHGVEFVPDAGTGQTEDGHA